MTPWTAACQASLSITNSRNLSKLMSIESVMPSNHLILCRPLLLPPSIFPSIRVFSNELVLRIKWPKRWSFSFSMSPSNEYSGLISLRIDWFDLLAVQGALKSLLQHHSLRHYTCFSVSVLQCSAFSTSNSHISTWLLEKPQLWLYRPLLAKWYLCFLIHFQVCHSFSSKEQASFNFVAAVTIHSDFGVQENKVCHNFKCFPICLLWSDGKGFHDLCFLNAEF